MSYRARKNIGKGCFLIIGVIIFALILMYIYIPHPDPKGATNVLTVQGYSNIEITGVRWFGRGDYWYSTEFKAIAPNGTQVTGYVTSGLCFAGNTVRID